MADAALKGQGAERADPTELDLGIAVTLPQEGGGVVVDFDGPQEEPAEPLTFASDLTSLFTPQRLQAIGHEIVQLVNEDDRSRAEWKKTYANGLKLLGLQYEERTEPWAGACGAFHPMLLESVIRFNAQAMMDIFPGAGPVKTDIVGKITPEKERQAGRVRTDMNWLATEKITGYRSETDMMLFNLPMAGTTFRKWGFDQQRKVPWAEYVLPEHLVMPYTASSLESSPRFAVILSTTRNKVESQMASGFYREAKLGTPVLKTDEITEAKDKIDGRSNSNTVDDNPFRLYESHIDYYFPEDTLPGDKLPHPYVITVDSTSNQVLAIRRNWKEGDTAFERQVSLVQHKYMPGFGPYGTGLINILGGLTDSATSILRQLVDAGTLKNLPAGFKTKGARIKDDSSPIGPGEFRDVDVSGGVLRDSFMPLPYGEPSTVLAALLGQIVDEGRRIGSVADMKITDMTGQNMPVGTTLAIIERSMKVMSAVQQRLYESFKNEFKVFAEIVKDFMSEIPYGFELDQRDAQATRKTDYDSKVDIIPVADPNATTMAQRIMVMQAVIQLTQTAPQIYNLPNVHRDMITVLGSDKADFYIPPPEDVQPRDPVTENMDLLNGRPVKAGIAQDHAAHIAVHMAAAQDPKIVQMLTNNPAAPAIMGAANAHILEHMAFQYRAEIEEQLGVPLPPPNEPLPEDVEYQLSRLAAAAAGKLLDKNKAEAQQKEILEKLQDPVVQNETESLAIKRMGEETKRMKVFGDLDDKEKNRQIDILLKIFEETAETDRAAISAQAQKDGMLDEKEIRMAELASELGQGVMGQLAQLLITRVKSDDSKAALAARRKTDA